VADGPPPRSATGGTVPSTFATGYRYAGLGYTTAMEAAVAPLAARHAHAELDDTPLIDSGFYVLLGNDDYLLRQIAAGELARARDYAGWLLGVTRAYAIKIVNPGGVAVWKDSGREGRDRVRERPPRSERRRGPGDVRVRHDRHRRRPGRAPAVCEQRPEVGERGHRARDGVRHRPLFVPGEGRGGGAAVGRGARAVPLGQRPVARGAFDRPSQWGHVPLVSGADPGPDGPRLPRRAAQGCESKAVEGQRTARWFDPGIYPGRDRDRHARRSRPAARALAEGTSRPGRGRRRDRVRAGRRPGKD